MTTRPSQQTPAADAPNVASSRNQTNSAVVLLAVLGTTSVAAAQRLNTRGLRASGPAEVLSQHVGLVFAKIKYSSISLLNM